MPRAASGPFAVRERRLRIASERPGAEGFPRARPASFLLRVVDRLDEFGDRLVGGLDLAMDELGHDVLVGIGDGRRRAVALGERAEQRAASRWPP